MIKRSTRDSEDRKTMKMFRQEGSCKAREEGKTPKTGKAV